MVALLPSTWSRLSFFEHSSPFRSMAPSGDALILARQQEPGSRRAFALPPARAAVSRACNGGAGTEGAWRIIEADRRLRHEATSCRCAAAGMERATDARFVPMPVGRSTCYAGTLRGQHRCQADRPTVMQIRQATVGRRDHITVAKERCEV